jgi:hypothetical protein
VAPLPPFDFASAPSLTSFRTNYTCQAWICAHRNKGMIRKHAWSLDDACVGRERRHGWRLWLWICANQLEVVNIELVEMVRPNAGVCNVNLGYVVSVPVPDAIELTHDGDVVNREREVRS